MALPFVQVSLLGSPQAWGALLLVAAGVGIAVSLTVARWRGEEWNDAALLPIAIVPALIFGHVWDVIAYRWSDHDPFTWLRVYDGQSLFGALLGVAVFTVVLVTARKRELPVYADIVALGCLAAMVIGRIGCALVHDHPGGPTDSWFGIDTFDTGWTNYTPYSVEGGGRTMRIHDLGLDELLLLVPMFAIAIVAHFYARLRAGMLAVIVALAYAAIRFPLDSLRLRMTEPVHAGLTAGQWGCIALAAIAVYGLVQIRRPTTA